MSFQQFSPTLPNATPNRSPLKISNLDILSSLDNKENFYELYVGTTNRAIDMYAKAARRKFALKLHGSLAALDVCVYSPSTHSTSKRSLTIPLLKTSWTPCHCTHNIYLTAGSLRTAYVDFS
jgi:hypothetical protein